MMSSLLPYSNYKESGVPWLEDIPEHWQIVPGRVCFREKKIKNTGNKVSNVLSLSYGKIVDRPVEKLHGLVPASFETYQIITSGDIIIRCTDLQNDQVSLRFGLSNKDGIITSAYMCLNTTDRLTSAFGYLLFHNYDITKVIYLLGSGLRQNLSWEDVKNLLFAIPPIEEQLAIVKYLDYVDKRVRKYVRTKQKQIKLLEEMKQAIIHQAVTRGLDSTIPLKPSAVDWLGEIPAHWEVLPGKLCLREKKTPNKGNEISKVLSLSYGKIIERPEEKLHGLVPSSFETYQVIEEDDIIVRSTDLQNDHVSWRFGLCTQQGIITSAYLCLQATKVITANFSYYLLHNYDITKDIYRFGSGLRQNLSWTDFKYLPIIVPPMNEQIQIVEYLDDIDYEYSQISMVLKNQINIIKELKDKSVTDVVTGKLDVREVASKLPDEIEELLEEPDETLEEGLENGEEMEEAIPEEE